jgi:dolichyl-diphosphooligosaccharide--protein glycosyltransferase
MSGTGPLSGGEAPPGPGTSWPLRWGAPLALFALALAIRCVAWREVFGVVRVMPVGSDAYYHLRRIAVAVFRHPVFLDFDPYLNFPEGARPIWPPLFDRLAATALRPLVPDTLEAGLPQLERLAMWIPALLGAATVVAVFALTRRHFGFAAGLLAGLVLSLLSGHYWYSQLGFLDHHVAVGLAATGVLAAGMGLVASRSGGGPLRVAGRAAALGFAGGLALLLWPGSLLHVGLVHLTLLAWMLSQPAEPARRLAGQLALAHALSLALLAPAGLTSDWPQWSAFSPVVLSRFQPWLFAVATLVCSVCALAWRSPSTRGRGARLASFVGVAALAAVGSLLLFGELAEGLGDAWRWLARTDAFQARVAESLPLLVEGGRWSGRVALLRLSGFCFALPFAIVWLALRARGAADAGPRALLLVFAGGLLAVALAQRRFFHEASIGLAVVFALTLLELWRLARSRSARFALAALALLLIAPTLTTYAAPLANEWRALRGDRIQVGGAFALHRAQRELTRWLRQRTPPTSGWLLEGAAPEYGVLAPWSLGHVIQHAGRRPTVVDNFGDDLGAEGFAFADRSYRSPESHALDGLDARRIRYVVVQERGGFLGGRPSAHSLLRSLFERDGSGSESPVPGGVAAVSRHRLVFESKGLYFRARDSPAVYKVFEVVRGALIEGRAAPGALVGLRLGVFTNRGREFHFATHAIADAAGVYRVRVPYANDGGPHGIRTASFYRLACGGELREVAVPEAAVVEGERVEAPALCLEERR